MSGTPAFFVGVMKSGGGVVECRSMDDRWRTLPTHLPGKKRWMTTQAGNTRLWFEGTANNWRAILEVIPDAFYTDLAKSEMQKVDVKDKMKSEAIARWTQTKEIPAEMWQWGFKTKPYEHQMKAWYLSKDLPVFALFMEQGTGKTKVAIDTAAWLYHAGEIDSILIIAPNGVQRQWIREQIQTHMPDSVGYKTLLLSTKSASLTKEIEKFNKFLAWKGGLRVAAMNCEGLSHANGVEVLRKFLSCTRTLLVVDESGRFRNPSASRTQALIKYGHLARYRRIMTGTPVTKGLENLYSQFYILDPDIIGYTTWTGFKGRYCNLGGFEGREIIGYKNLEEIQRKIGPFTFRVSKAECLDLPPKVYEKIEFQMNEEQKRLYKQMKEEALANVLQGSGGLVEATNAMAVLSKLHQIACGFLMKKDEITGDTSVVWRVKNNPRIAAVHDILEDAGYPPTIIWCHYREDISAVRDSLEEKKIKCSVFWGGLSPTQQDEQVHRFMAGVNDVFIGQSGAGGTGLNLQRATQTIYYSNSFDAETRWQSEDRNHRIGQNSSVTYTDLVAIGTVDKKIRDSLLKKEKIAVVTMSGLQSFIEEDDDD